MSLLDLLRSDGSIVVNKKLAHAVGVDAAIMYSELISKQFYFESREQLTEDGFFFNTVDNMQEDTALTKYQQSKAIKKLVELKLIHHQNRGLPQRRYFKINENEQNIASTLDAGQKLKNQLLEVKELNSNNTKVNNNKRTKRYTIGQANDDYILQYYSFKYKQQFKRDHPTITFEQLDKTNDIVGVFRNEYDVQNKAWQEAIDEHFDGLSEGNNGSILGFITGDDMQGPLVRYLNIK